MRMATSPHHTNPRSATLDFWRQTSSIDDYKRIQAKRRLQTNRPTSSNQQKSWIFHFFAFNGFQFNGSRSVKKASFIRGCSSCLVILKLTRFITYKL